MNDQIKSWGAMRQRGLTTQTGAVLFFTLIALVGMTLAALALMRSVDTSNLVAGNIALKQGAIQEADRVMNQAFSCLDNGGALLAVGMTTTTANTAAPICNYYAFLQPDASSPFGVPDALEAAPGVTDATTGNTSAFVIERMCTDPTPAAPATTGPWDEATCISSPFGKAVSVTDRAKPSLTPPQALYRISVVVRGPRNVRAYSQMVMNAGI